MVVAVNGKGLKADCIVAVGCRSISEVTVRKLRVYVSVCDHWTSIMRFYSLSSGLGWVGLGFGFGFGASPRTFLEWLTGIVLSSSEDWEALQRLEADIPAVGVCRSFKV